MTPKRAFVFLNTFLLCLCSFTVGQNTAPWTVNPDWVRAHEMFLASDAMRGRGSATPDEWIAATYVASEFESYGLKPGLPDGTYIQRAQVAQPVLEEGATLSAAGAKTMLEPQDFRLLRSNGESVSGSLQKVAVGDLHNAQIKPGGVLLVTGEVDAAMIRPVLQEIFTMRNNAPALIMLVESKPLDEFFEQRFGGKTMVESHVVGVSPASTGFARSTIAMLSSADAEELAKAPDRSNIHLDVKAHENTRYTYNAVGLLTGSDTSSSAKVLLLSAHLDHLGIGRAVNGDDIYNGANDDASGTTAVMELAHALAAGPQPKRSIYFVCYGSEELGGFGSSYFRDHPPVPLDRIAANLEFEMIGNQDPKMPKGRLLLTGWDRSNLGPTLVAHGALLGNDPYPEEHFFQRSDNYPLALKGVVAQTAAGWGTPPTYHQPDDDIAHLNFQFMTEAIQSLIEPMRWLANSDFVPQWLPGKKP